jgi:hypothetical protein
MTQYRAIVGIDYPPNKRVEAGETVSDLPEKSVTWLLASGFIEALDGKGKKTTPVVEITEEPIVVETPLVPKGFKSNAKDGDKDGFVQDGTPFMRPVEEK